MASEESSAKATTPPPATTETAPKTEAAPEAEGTEAPTTQPAADQIDGSGKPGNGNALAETELKVEVKLADLQADPENPLYSVKTFEELKL